MDQRRRKTFGRAGLEPLDNPPDDPMAAEPPRLIARWRAIRVGHRAMLAMFGGAGVIVALGLLQGEWHVAVPPWLGLPAMLCAVGGIAYAYTRRCPSCGAGGVVTSRGPQRDCDKCGTPFL
jgi:ribosomal protein S27AE